MHGTIPGVRGSLKRCVFNRGCVVEEGMGRAAITSEWKNTSSQCIQRVWSIRLAREEASASPKHRMYSRETL